MPDVGEDFENVVNGGYLLLILGAAGLIVWVLYEVYESGKALSTALCNLPVVCLLGGSSCPNCSNPLSSASLDSYTSGDTGVDTTNMDAADMSGMTA